MKTRFANWLLTVVIVGIVLRTPVSLAQAPYGTMAIEQDWKVELLVMPDGNRLTSPLFVSSFSIPLVSALFQCTWNHRDVPLLEEGGIQLQVYKWDDLLDEQEILTPPWREKLNIDDELITWTQRLAIVGMDYRFTIKNISSKTWGEIAGPYTIKRTFLVWVPPLELYNFQEIADNSGIVMGGNRFKRMTILQTRFYDGNGILLRTDPAATLFPPMPGHPSYEFVTPNE
jgi:hypothetical protein